jgi:hypothetical protein
MNMKYQRPLRLSISEVLSSVLFFKVALSYNPVNNFKPAASTCADTIRGLALQLLINTHVTFNSYSINQLRHMISARVDALSTSYTFFDIHYRDSKKMHLHGAGGADAYTGEIPTGSAVNKFLHPLAKSAHCHAAMLFFADGYAGCASSTCLSVLFNIHVSLLLRNKCYL